MRSKQIKRIAFVVIMSFIISKVSAQDVLKLGSNPYIINEKAVLDIESTTRGFLPPRMTKLQRNAITTPPAGLQVWCTDCNVSTEPASGQLCIYLGTAWAPIDMNLGALVTTGKRGDANAPSRTSATAANIKGMLVEITGAAPVETGVVYKPIVGNDFTTLPLLDATGSAIAPNLKATTSPTVVAGGNPISVNVTGLGATPYYYRAYAKSYLGIGYGNTVVFNAAEPSFTTPVVTDGTGLYPKFSGTMTVNAGTPAGTVTEYGYASGTTSSPTTDMKVISTTASIAAINASLSGEHFSQNPTFNLQVDDYDLKSIGTKYFRFYVIANGTTTYSPDVSFTPVGDASTGGTAQIVIKSVVAFQNTPFKIEESSGKRTITVTYDVTKKGTYQGLWVTGNNAGPTTTTGLTISGGLASGTFTTLETNKTFTYEITGTPMTSLDGIIWTGSYNIGNLSSGSIAKGDITATRARCDNILYNPTTLATVTSPATGRIWMDRNLGAYRQAISSTDTQAYGCLFQMGRSSIGGHADMNRGSGTASTASTAVNSTSTTLVSSNSQTNLFVVGGNWETNDSSSLWVGIGAINNPCPSGYRLPTEAEASAMIDGDKYAGMINTLKFTFAGRRDRLDGSIAEVGSTGVYWTSLAGGSFQASSYHFFSDTTTYKNQARYKSSGFSVRCIKD